MQLGFISSGEFGSVYRAKHIRTGCLRALKFVKISGTLVRWNEPLSVADGSATTHCRFSRAVVMMGIFIGS